MSDELALEQAALDRIRLVHAAHLDGARAQAEQLASEAAESTSDGIRDLVDEDAEVDAAVAAAMVRQLSARAMHAIRRVDELEGMGEALAFGHTTDTDGRVLRVGRLTVIDPDDDDALLVDWRAEAAVPFYQATPVEPLGVSRRRHLQYGDRLAAGQRGAGNASGDLVDFSDELFDVDDVVAAGAESDRTVSVDGLRGEAALLAALDAPSAEQMRSVVATIQAEQDAVVRAPSEGALVVQGGPGTGKTVVALHRAAYLLYAQRARLTDTGVLVVGPSHRFLGYIREVLPSLGETGVVSAVPASLYPGILLGHAESVASAERKGRADLADALVRALRLRRRRPDGDLVLWYGSRRVVLRADGLHLAFARAAQEARHNDGAAVLRDELRRQFLAEVHDPTFIDADDARHTFDHNDAVEEFCLRHWPSLSPEQALNDLLGSRAMLAAIGFSPDDVDLLHRPRTPERELGDRRWSDADVPLLDELEELLGVVGGTVQTRRDAERDDADEFEQARRADLDRRAAELEARGGDDGELGVEVSALSFEQLAELDTELTEELLSGLEADPYPDDEPDPGPWMGWEAHG